MTFDDITAERRRLYETGKIRLERLANGQGRMAAVNRTDAEAWQIADRYNALAALHQATLGEDKRGLPKSVPSVSLTQARGASSKKPPHGTPIWAAGARALREGCENMGEQPKLNIELPGVDFAGLAREAIAAKLTEAMVGADDAIRKIVAAALVQKVNERGIVNERSSYENKIPFIEWLLQDLVRSATLEIIKAKVDRLRPSIEQEVERQLLKQAKPIAKVVCEQFLAQAKSSYGVTISVGILPRDR